jgi:glycine/D-amino acid oxidase-like deaminating enzyme
MRVVICGGGVIGASIAYFLARRGAAVTVVERTGIACAASGKAGGFLARDWNDGTPLEQLARRSFALHAQLADELGGDWGYRRLTTYGGFSGFGGGRNESGLGWLSDEVTVSRPLGSPETTAQVHPALFTAAMMRAAEAHGAELRIGTVAELVRNGDAVTGAVVDGETIEADAVVIAMGPWSILAAQWLPLPPVFGLKGHSLVFDTGGAVPAEALFLECRERGGAAQTPEVFPRPDGTTYVCAISSEALLPLDPAAVEPDPGAIERLHAICRDISPTLATAKVLAAQACHRPVARDGLPLLGAVPGAAGAYIATGHSVWGILNAPATGEAMAELIAERSSTLDLSPFDPGRMRPLDPKRLQMG